jgi:glycosyltransferase involved in cell wall biosynthesis
LNKKRKIKVCHLSSVHYALDTRIFYKYCTYLAQSYFDVTLIACHPEKAVINKVKIIPFKRYHNRRLRMLFAWVPMLFKALNVKAEIYHFHDPELIPCGLFLKLFGKKVIYDIHENIADDIFDKPWVKNKWMTYQLFNLIEVFSLRFFSIVLAEESYLKRYGKKSDKCLVIQNYCDLTFFEKHRKKEPGSPFNLFYIGIVLETRGFLQICEVVHLLHQKGHPVHFHCVGELYTDLRTKIEQLPYYDNIKSYLHFYGRMSLDDGYKISEKAGIGLCIIYPMKNSMESYPTKLFEYMAVGLPVVTSDFPLYKEVIEYNQTGLCVDPLNPEAICMAIENLILDKALYEKCYHNGFEVVRKHYNWESERVKLIYLYLKLS